MKICLDLAQYVTREKNFKNIPNLYRAQYTVENGKWKQASGKNKLQGNTQTYFEDCDRVAVFLALFYNVYSYIVTNCIIWQQRSSQDFELIQLKEYRSDVWMSIYVLDATVAQKDTATLSLFRVWRNLPCRNSCSSFHPCHELQKETT